MGIATRGVAENALLPGAIKKRRATQVKIGRIQSPLSATVITAPSASNPLLKEFDCDLFNLA